MDKILQCINEKTNDKYQYLSLKEAILNKENSTIQTVFEYPRNVDITDKIKEIELLCKQYFEKNDIGYKIEAKFLKFTMSFERFKSECINIFASFFDNYTFSDNDFSFEFEKEKTVVKATLNKKFDQNFLAENKNLIENAFFQKFQQKIEVQYLLKQIENIEEISQREIKILEDNYILESQQNNQFAEIYDVVNVVGEINENIANFAGFEQESGISTIAGDLKNFALKESRQNVYEDNPEKKSNPRKYLSFDLTYNNARTKCFYFFKKDQELFELDEKKQYVVNGNFNKYNDGITFLVKSIAECKIKVPKIAWRECPKKYSYIEPERFVQTEQVGLFFVEEETKCKYLRDNSFVVYDLETTGLNLSFDKIIDIGAFKIVNGKIVEKFSTFVNPEIHIPEQASKVNRITDDLVADYPSIEKILPDFYKFCYGSIMVGYNNLGFDDVFVNREGKKYRYNFFDIERNDAMILARQNLPELRNHKLATVCANQNVPLVDAHRAVNDALATAKLFIKLTENFIK